MAIKNNNTTLTVLAAGMGSRFGGLKQIEPLGPDGQILLDYSVYDAKEAGFNKTVFIIKKEIEKDFREVIGKRIEKLMDVDYAFQELDKVPEWFNIPSERVKPWGTSHAVLCAKDVIKSPFCVINADDYYGNKSFKDVHDFLVKGTNDYCMSGFMLKNTLTENGTVSRGVCEVNDNNELLSIVERTKINNQRQFTEDGENWIQLPEDTMVSMNMWGFPLEIFDALESGFTNFLKEKGTVEKSEYFLPLTVDAEIKAGKKVIVLPTTDKWYGVTYKEDKPSVMEALNALHSQGMYKGL